MATEIVITTRGGDHSVVRMVHSVFSSSDDWDDQVEGFESGWPGFFEVLKVYLRYFAGMKAECLGAMATIEAEINWTSGYACCSGWIWPEQT